MSLHELPAQSRTTEDLYLDRLARSVARHAIREGAASVDTDLPAHCGFSGALPVMVGSHVVTVAIEVLRSARLGSMGLVTDLCYLLVGIITMPIWVVALWWRGKLKTDWAARLGLHKPQIARGTAGGPRVLIHAVSVGEVNAVRLLADRLASELGANVIVSTTTNTGIARARAAVGGKHQVVRFPVDFSWAMRGLLDVARPDIVLLAELELWPNFMRLCTKRGIPVAVVNGRLSDRSFARSIRFRTFLRPMFAALSRVSAQDETYSMRFTAMGTPKERVFVGGTMKWDSADVAETVEGANELREAMGIDQSLPLVVAGSTAPGEEELLRRACPEGVQLMCAPRKPEWFESAAKALAPCTRRSKPNDRAHEGRFVLDTIGELRKAYALADVVVIGRSFGNLHGSDMMEPAGMGKAIVVGPRVGDFQTTADRLIQANAMIQTTSESLAFDLKSLLSDQAQRAALGRAAREVVRSEQGATARNVAMARELLEERRSR